MGGAPRIYTPQNPRLWMVIKLSSASLITSAGTSPFQYTKASPLPSQQSYPPQRPVYTTISLVASRSTEPVIMPLSIQTTSTSPLVTTPTGREPSPIIITHHQPPFHHGSRPIMVHLKLYLFIEFRPSSEPRKRTITKGPRSHDKPPEPLGSLCKSPRDADTVRMVT